MHARDGAPYDYRRDVLRFEVTGRAAVGRRLEPAAALDVLRRRPLEETERGRAGRLPAPHALVVPAVRPAVLGDEEIAEVVDTLRSGWITTGPKIERFAAAFLEYVGGRFAVPVSSATAGLHVALLALGVGPGDEVITTPMTFVATLNTIVHCGAVPVLADIDAATLQHARRGDREAAHAAHEGDRARPLRRASRWTSIRSSSSPRRRGIAVLEDAAHAVGTEYKGRRIGSFPTTSVFSFHPNKNMTTGEGGMVVTEDEDVFEQASLLKFHGMDREAWKRFAKAGSPRYDVAVPGFKYNMMDIQAALGLHQLPRLDGFIAERDAPRRALRRGASPASAGLILPPRVAVPGRATPGTSTRRSSTSTA